MKTIQVQLPDTIYEYVERMAREADVSMDQFIAMAVSNEIVREETSDFFRQAAARYDAKSFAEALAAVPDGEPVPGDEL